MSKTSNKVKEFAAITFLLLGILFGMMIMTFVFGQIGVANANTVDAGGLVANESAAWINETLYTVAAAGEDNWTGGFAVTTVYNSSDGEIILDGNYTIDADAGTITNTTNTVWLDVNVTYTYTYKTNSELIGEEVQNNSLQGIVAYTAQTPTQLTTIAIAITLVILIAVFLLFWLVFVKGKKKTSGGNFS